MQRREMITIYPFSLPNWTICLILIVRAPRESRLSRERATHWTLNRHLNTVHETFRGVGSNRTWYTWEGELGGGHHKDGWSSLRTRYHVWTEGETPAVGEVEENMVSYFNVLQGPVSFRMGVGWDWHKVWCDWQIATFSWWIPWWLFWQGFETSWEYFVARKASRTSIGD